MGSSNPKSIAILGAGITGLTAAHRLVRRGHRVRVFEATDRVGGAIRTEIVNEWLIEAGPNSILSGDPAFAGLVAELGLTNQFVPANPAAKNRYIVRRGVPIPAPLSPPGLLRSPLFSLGAKVRILAEMLARPRLRLSDLSLEEFIRGHFGQEVVDYALNPFVTGVYAGNPKKLSARHAFPKLWEAEQKHGSLLRGQMAAAKSRGGAKPPGIVSFARGLQTLPDAIAAMLPVGTLAFGARLEALVRDSTSEPRGKQNPPHASSANVGVGPIWNLVWRNGATTLTEHFDAVIAALPAPALAQLRFGTLGERPLASLETIEHPPVSSLFLGYRREQVAHPLDGFGMLVPEVERRAVLGVLFSSTLFPGRAPAGHVALTVLVGGTRDPERARLPADKLLAAIEPDLRQLLGVSGPPVFQRHTFWPKAIPQYNVGHNVHLDTIAAAERAYPGVFIGGQARDGISLPACIAAGERLAACVS